MKKTAMQLMIEDVKRMEQGLDVEELSAYFQKKATELLETERGQIEEAFNESRKTHPMIGFKHETFDKYYKDTYQ